MYILILLQTDFAQRMCQLQSIIKINLENKLFCLKDKTIEFDQQYHAYCLSIYMVLSINVIDIASRKMIAYFLLSV